MGILFSDAAHSIKLPLVSVVPEKVVDFIGVVEISFQSDTDVASIYLINILFPGLVFTIICVHHIESVPTVPEPL